MDALQTKSVSPFCFVAQSDNAAGVKIGQRKSASTPGNSVFQVQLADAVPGTQSGESPPAARTECAAPAGDDFMQPAWSSQRRLQLQVGRGPREPAAQHTRPGGQDRC